MKRKVNFLICLMILFAVFVGFNDEVEAANWATDIQVDGDYTDTIEENLSTGTVIGTITNDGTYPVTYDLGCTITPGVDDTHFQINGDQLETAAVFDYDNPVDANTDNDYEICIRSNNGLVFDFQYYEQPITVTVTQAADTTPPVITLNGDANVTLSVGDNYADAGATCSDDVDPTCTVVTVNPVDTDIVGMYTVTYNAEDTAGNDAIEVTRTVNVADTTPPVITLTGAAEVTVYQGASYTDEGATCSDDVDPTCTVITVNPVDTATIGNYTVTYNAQDDAGNDATEVTRTVNVVEEESSSSHSSSRRISRAAVNQIFGTPITTTTTTPSPSSDQVYQIQMKLISLLTQLIVSMKG